MENCEILDSFACQEGIEYTHSRWYYMSGRRFTVVNESFICRICQRQVLPLQTGCRNHCPHCLHSVHLDRYPGDRAADCGGTMEPIEVYQHSKKGYMIRHRCCACGHESVNKLALDDPDQPDDFELVLKIFKASAK